MWGEGIEDRRVKVFEVMGGREEVEGGGGGRPDCFRRRAERGVRRMIYYDAF